MTLVLFDMLVEGALLVLLTASVQPSPICPVADGDSCKEVKFYLWTRLNPGEPQEVASSNITSSHFNHTHPTKMVIHGYASGMNLEQLAAIRREYLALGEYNLIYPQYLDLVDSPCYLTAVINVDYVGKCVARFIRSLDVPRKPSEPSPASPLTGKQVLGLHVIGFSLGAQTAAFTANHLKPELHLERITGLDPALPFFITSDRDKKLTPDDAVFVDVVHTNAFMQGQGNRCGHVDFYMNGGVNQPGCRSEGFWNMMKCDHHRAPTYFSESIRSEQGFWGWTCSSIEDYDMGRCPATGAAVLVGAWADRRSEGFYVVQTRSEAPFARGKWWPSGEESALVLAHRPSTPACEEEPCVRTVR